MDPSLTMRPHAAFKASPNRTNTADDKLIRNGNVGEEYGESRERVHHIPSREKAWADAVAGPGGRICAVGPAVLVCLIATKIIKRTHIQAERGEGQWEESFEKTLVLSLPIWPRHQIIWLTSIHHGRRSED